MDKLSKSLVILCCCLAYFAAAKYHMHTQYQNQCPGAQYEFVDDVLYCDYLGRLVKPKDYEERMR